MYGTHHQSDVVLTLHQLFRFFSDLRLLLFIFCFSGIKTATEELKSVSDDFNNIFHDMEDSLKITQDSTHTIADNTVTQAAQTADMKEKIDAIGDLIAMISENVDALNASRFV